MKKRKGSHGKQSRATKAAIRAGVRLYWKRVKKLKKKAAVSLVRARRLYRAGVGRPKREVGKAAKRRLRAAGRFPRVLWESEEGIYLWFDMEERLTEVRIPTDARDYSCMVRYIKDGMEDPFEDELDFTATGREQFFGELTARIKDWFKMIAGLFGGDQEKDYPAEGKATMHRIAQRKEGSGGKK